MHSSSGRDSAGNGVTRESIASWAICGCNSCEGHLSPIIPMCCSGVAVNCSGALPVMSYTRSRTPALPRRSEGD